ncbi:MAG: Crp/Fnr family transcriptional regulator [Bacteroidota bacterium]
MKTESSKGKMKEIIQSHLVFSEESYNLLLNIATEREVRKNRLIFHPDKPTNKILFLKKGLLRGYKIIDGKEHTHHFYFADWFATDFHSFLTAEPSQIYIQTLEDAVFFEFQKKDLLNLYATSHQLEALGRLIAEKAFVATVEKLANMQLYNLAEKYEFLMKTNPGLIQRVPQKYIASYLGVSEQSLSRIKQSVIS